MSEEDQKKQRVMSGRQLVSFAWHYWRQYPFRMGYVLFSVFAAIGVDLLYPRYASEVVDAVARGFAGEEGQEKVAMVALICMTALAVMHHALRISGYYVWMRVASNCLAQLARDALAKVQRLSTEWHANSFSGATIRKITRGKWAFDGLGDTLILSLLPSACIVIGMVVVQYMYWSVMGWIFAIGFGIYIFVSIFMALHFVFPANRDFNQFDSKLGGTLADIVTCNTVVKAFGSEAREDKIFENESEIWTRKVMKSWRRMVDMDFVQSMLMSVMLFVVMAASLSQWMKGIFTPGDVSYALTSFFIVSSYVRNIGNQIRQLQKAIGEIEDVVLIREMSFDIADDQDAKQLDIRKGQIDFEHVGFSYDRGMTPIYNDFSISIKPGEKVALVGHSGSGKSTFVKLVQRLYDVNQGRICIDGQNISKVGQQSLRQAISLVPQDPILFHRSIADNIAYARPDASRSEIEEAAQMAFADQFIERLPDGYDTLVGERGVKLSGGERQRVAIARAILANKPILILDEATSSLDSVSEHYIQEAVDNLTKDRTTIMVAHRLSTIKAVDRILVFDSGKIVEQGTHADLIQRQDGQYKKLFDMQSFGLIGGDEATELAE